MDRIEKLKEDLLAKIDILDKDVYNNNWCKGKIEGFREVLSSIDSLQEVPVSIWHDGCEIPKSETNILMIRKDKEDSNYPPIAGCFHGTNSRLDGRNWGYYNGFCYNEIEPPLKWAYVDDLFNNLDKKEPVSEELEKIAELYTLDDSMKPWRNLTKEAFIGGAKWQKNKMMEDAVDGIIAESAGGDGWVNVMTGFVNSEDVNVKFGDKIKIIVVKED